MIAVLLIGAGYLLLAAAWLLHRGTRQGAALACVVGGAALLRLGPALDPDLHPWDERYHALVAKNMLRAPLHPMLYTDPLLPHDDADWTRSRTWLHKPPLALWCMAASIQLFGTKAWAVRVPSILFACIGAALCYRLARSLAGAEVGFWSAVLFALNGHLIELAAGRTSTDHVDALLVVLVLGGCAAALRLARAPSWRRGLAAGLFMGAAFLTKGWPALLIALVALCALLLSAAAPLQRRAAAFAVLVLAAMAIALPWQVHSWWRFPLAARAEAEHALLHFSQAIEGHGRPWHYYLAQLPMMHGELAPVAIVGGAWLARRWPRTEAVALLAWAAAPFAVFSMAESKMPAYTAIAAPALFILIAQCAVALARERGRWRWSALAAAALVIALPLRFSIDRAKPGPATGRSAWPRNAVFTARDVLLHCDDPIAAMFFTDAAAAYADGLDPLTVGRLRGAGYRLHDLRMRP